MHTRIRLSVGTLLLLAGYLSLSESVGQAQQTVQVMRKPVVVHYDYLLHLPPDYKTNAERTYPLVLFLHGAGERGSDIQLVKKHGPPKLVESDPDFPAIVVSPQCPEGERWMAFKLNVLLEHIASEFRVDRKRIYLTGLSMGGEGTWDFANRYPDWFAALAPICGGGNVRQIGKYLTEIPTWAFHGMRDTTIPLERTLEIVRELEKQNGKVRFTVYPEAGHDSWTATYANPEFWKWMFAQRKA